MDGSILVWIQENLRQEWLNGVMIFITSLGDVGFIWIALAFLFLINKSTRKMGILALITMALTYLIVNVFLKEAVARTRPFFVVEGLIPLIKLPKDYSFPSGHTAASFASAVIYFCELKKYRWLPMIFAVVIGFSRLYVGVHYLTDVVCGAVIATLVALAVLKANKEYQMVRKRLE